MCYAFLEHTFPVIAMNCMLILLLLTIINENFASLNLRFHWSRISLDFGIAENGKEVVEEDSYKLWTHVFTGMALWKDTLFLSIIKENLQLYNCFDYAPEPADSTLNYIDFNTTENAPLLKPYRKDEVDIRNISHMEIDVCNRLWSIDRVNKELVVFDLSSNQTPIRKYKLHSKALKMHAISVDVNSSDCENAYVYMPYYAHNLTISVYHLKSDESWTVNEPIYPPYMKNFDYVTFIAPTSTLSNANEDGYRTLFIQARWSNYILSISTKLLQTPDAAADDPSPHCKILGINRENNAESNLVHYDKSTGILFYDSNRGQHLGCWNPTKFENEFSSNTIKDSPIFEGKEFMFALSGDEDGNLWIGTRKQIQRFPMRKDEFYVYRFDIKEFVNGSVCE